MPAGFKPIQVSDSAHERLRLLGERVAKKDGIAKVSFSSLIDRMVKVYEEKLDTE